MAAFTKSEFIWLNGELTPWDSAQIHVTAHGLHYGTGVFEGMRSYSTADGPAIFRLDAHMRRFAQSASFYELDLGYSFDELCAASLDVVRANGLEDAYLRPIAFFDSHSFSVWPKDCPVTVAIIAVPGRQYIQGGPEHGVRVTVSTVRRIDSQTLPPFVKACGHYTNSVRAVQEAFRRGFDEAILLNSKGDVAEGSGANLFFVKNGTLYTNDIDASIVLGITRDSVLQIGARHRRSGGDAPHHARRHPHGGRAVLLRHRGGDHADQGRRRTRHRRRQSGSGHQAAAEDVLRRGARAAAAVQVSGSRWLERRRRSESGERERIRERTNRTIEERPSRERDGFLGQSRSGCRGIAERLLTKRLVAVRPLNAAVRFVFSSVRVPRSCRLG